MSVQSVDFQSVFKKQRTGECYDYMYGFCIHGPLCKYRHTQKPFLAVKEMPKIPEWYINKIKDLFGKDMPDSSG